MVTSNDLKRLLFQQQPAPERHAYGTVMAANADGTLEVALSPDATTTCASLAPAAKGDRVLVVVFGQSACVLGTVQQ